MARPRPTGPPSNPVPSLILASLILLLATTPALAREATPEPGQDAAALILATTTSTQDSGLLDELLPAFTDQSGISVKPIAVGSGAALELGERGEADVVLAHSPAAEDAFMAAGYGTERRTVMVNDFVLVGPAEDPAGVGAAGSIVAAMAAIANAETPFVSRSDDSGTHALERRLWAAAGVEPAGAWYTEAGTGMAETLQIADERRAYTLTDRGTWLALADRLDLPIARERDPELLNAYHVIAVNPANGRNVNAAGAATFVDFVVSPAAQAIIAAFGTDRFGEPLFTPCADNACGSLPAATPAATPAA